MVFFEKTNPNILLEAADRDTFSLLRESHPELWPLPPFRINKRNQPIELIEVGCLAAPTVELTHFTHEPKVFSPDGSFQYNQPSLATLFAQPNSPKTRWDESSDEGNPDETRRVESLLLSPKTPAIREAFLHIFESLQSRPEAKKLLGQYKRARLKRMDIGVEDSSSSSKKMQTKSYTFHALHDVIAANAPTIKGLQGEINFWLPNQKIKDFAPPIIFANYVEKARAIAALFGSDIGRILIRDLASAEALLADYSAQLEEYKKEKDKKWRDPDDQLAPHAWNSSIFDKAYPSAKNYDPRHSQLHWSAAILDYFVNLHDLYGKLHAKKISTSIPTIGPTISATKLMHIPRSLEALKKPDRTPEPVTIELPAQKSVIFIGSNNSGKSFTMEMIAANVMESMQGRKTFAKSFESPEFHAVIAIPAELPHETGKSTYTGQLARLVQAIAEITAIQEIKPDANVLLMADELFAGTDEHDSAALYKATIEWMNAHRVTLVGATNNELVFDPDIAEFISMVNRKPIVVLQSEDIIAKRQGIPVLANAGLPAEIIARAGELADTEVSLPDKQVNVAHFSELRNTMTMGILDQGGQVTSVGENFLLWSTGTERPPLFRQSDILKRLFGSAATDPLKIQYRQWESEIRPADMQDATQYMYRIAAALSNCIDIPKRLESNGAGDPPERILQQRFSSMVEQAQESLKNLRTLETILPSLPDTMRSQVSAIITLTTNTLEKMSAIETTGISSSALGRALTTASETARSITREQLSTFDAINCFFHLQAVFTTHNFCTVTKSTAQSITATDLYHTGLMYDYLEKKKDYDDAIPPVTNTIKISAGSPAMLLGANASGKSTLAEAFQIATYFAIHFGHAPAAGFSVPDSIVDSIGLVDYLRDPERPEDRGKWYSRQTQIASIIKKAEHGGHVIILDEPGEGTNGFEGRATLIAIAEYLTAKGNIVLFTTHQHKAVDILEESIGIQAFASGLDGKGRYSFSPGKASSLGLEMALEEGLLPEIVERAHEIKMQLTAV